MLFRSDAGIPVAPGLVAHAGRTDVADFAAEAIDRFGAPLFVKPARQGSSIGISRATDETSLQEALAVAFQHDSKVVVEQAIEGVEVDADERYFRVDVDAHEVNGAGHTVLEQRVMQSWRWFSREELLAHSEPYFPTDLIALLDATEPTHV